MGFVLNEILLGDVRDVGRVLSLGEDMVIGLILAGSNLFGDREPPLLGVIEEGVDIENHTAKGPIAVDHDFADPKFRISHFLIASFREFDPGE